MGSFRRTLALFYYLLSPVTVIRIFIIIVNSGAARHVVDAHLGRRGGRGCRASKGTSGCHAASFRSRGARDVAPDPDGEGRGRSGADRARAERTGRGRGRAVHRPDRIAWGQRSHTEEPEDLPPLGTTKKPLSEDVLLGATWKWSDGSKAPFPLSSAFRSTKPFAG